MIASEIRLFDQSDTRWIAPLIDLVERSLGEPWRVLLERVEHAPQRVHRSRVTAILGALRRVAGGRAERQRLARKARALVLGHPALDRDARDARLAAAACALGVTPAEVERDLWADLAMERPVALPAGRPREATLAAFANLDAIRRAVRRARAVRISVGGDAHELVRTVARYGLLATISREDGATVLDVTGPLALFHSTTVYGRALAELVPLLAEYERFTLDVQCEIRGHLVSLRVEPPLLLPMAPAVRRRSPSIAEQLARDLTGAGRAVEREPAPIEIGSRLLYPDLVVDTDDGRTWIEVVGFSTVEYLDHKLARYREAGIERVILCVDGRRGEVTETEHVVAFLRRVEAHRIEERLDA